MIKDVNNKEVPVIVPTYVLQARSPFLIGKKTMKQLKGLLDFEEETLQISLHGNKSTFRLTGESHPMLELQKLEGKKDKEIFIMEEEQVVDFKGVKKNP